MQPAKAQSKGATAERANSQKKARRRRPPRTAAVSTRHVVAAMRKAREDINLEELGIQVLKPKWAITGALILEVPGPNGKEKAAILKDRIEVALGEMEGMRVASPMKMT